MLIRSSKYSNIGKTIGAFLSPHDKFNARFYGPINSNSGLPVSSKLKYHLKMHDNGLCIGGYINDINRNFIATYQDVKINYNTTCYDSTMITNGTATGHFIFINGIPQTVTYIDGTGTATWTLRISTIPKKDDIITYSYNQSIGNVYTIDKNLKVLSVSLIAISNLLTKRIRFILRKSDNSLIVNENIKLAVFSYNSMQREMISTTLSDANGIVDIQYIGNANSGNQVYIAVMRPNLSPIESFIWNYTLL